jgi:hypothetical protein
MKIDKVYLKTNTPFANVTAAWLSTRNIESTPFNHKTEEVDEGIDGLVIFSENQELDRDTEELKSAFDRKQKPVHTIDINGTLMVAVSNLDLWFERNKCKKVLFVGSDSMTKNPNFERLLDNLR